jgi:uncharacterized membrane protein YozB (DUF420 family)
MDYTFLATVNASLNAISFVFLMFGITAIKKGNQNRHERFMTAACVTTLIFLACYLFYHFKVGHVPFNGEGPVRILYLVILTTHVFLAATIAVMIPITYWRAHKQRWESHKRIAKITFPFWVYVSVTGVIIYVMVYHIYAAK